MKRRTDVELMNWLEEHSVDWDSGAGAYFPWLNPPVSHNGTLREAIEKAMGDELLDKPAQSDLR